MKRWIGITAQGEAIRDTITDGIPEQAGVTFMEVGLTEPIDIANQYWSNGAWASKSVRPNSEFRFNCLTAQWEDPRTLEDLKAVKSAYINEARTTANQTSFTFEGKEISADTVSRSDIDATHGGILFTGRLPDPWVGGWKTVDNSFVAIPDVATWGRLYMAMVNQGTINFMHSQELKARLASAQSQAEVEAIIW